VTTDARRERPPSLSTSASRTEIGLIYFTGIAQGLAQVTFPAASSIFTSPDGFGFDSTRYGALFVPQVILAIVVSSLAPALARRSGLRSVLLLGLAGDIVAMTLLSLSRLLTGAPDTAFGVLLVATAALGIGFGATVMALNTYAEAYFPGRTDRAVLALNALIGLGTALAPLLVAIFIGLRVWWLLPVGVACILAGIFAVVLIEPLRAGPAPAIGHRDARLLPRRFWLYAAAAFLYGILETLNGNWAIVYLNTERGVSAQGAATALATFWGMLTFGRVLFAVISARVSARLIYVVLPILLIAALQLASRVQGETGGILAFAMTGLACSAFFPLNISFGGDEFPDLAAVMAGELLAFYQLGYGVAAFGTGPLRDFLGLSLSMIFAGASAVALLLVMIAALTIRRAF
jgi:MFS transporter, FHS family, glucose/mannose:H+ symporter